MHCVDAPGRGCVASETESETGLVTWAAVLARVSVHLNGPVVAVARRIKCSVKEGWKPVLVELYVADVVAAYAGIVMTVDEALLR